MVRFLLITVCLSAIACQGNSLQDKGSIYSQSLVKEMVAGTNRVSVGDNIDIAESRILANGGVRLASSIVCYVSGKNGEPDGFIDRYHFYNMNNGTVVQVVIANDRKIEKILLGLPGVEYLKNNYDAKEHKSVEYIDLGK